MSRVFNSNKKGFAVDSETTFKCQGYQRIRRIVCHKKTKFNLIQSHIDLKQMCFFVCRIFCFHWARRLCRQLHMLATIVFFELSHHFNGILNFVGLFASTFFASANVCLFGLRLKLHHLRWMHCVLFLLLISRKHHVMFWFPLSASLIPSAY